MRRTGKAIGTLAAATSLALVGGGLAYADNIDNNVVTSGGQKNDSIEKNGSTTITYFVDKTKDANENPAVCNVTSAEPAKVRISAPEAVTMSSTGLSSTSAAGTRSLELTFTDCGTASNGQRVNVTFGSTEYGIYRVTHEKTQGHGNVIVPAAGAPDGPNFTLRVLDLTDPVLSSIANVTVDATSASAGPASWTASATDNVGVTAISCVSGTTSLDGAALSTSNGVTSRTFTNDFTVGSHDVSCTATDAVGNRHSRAHTVTVNPYVAPTPTDRTPPSVTFVATGDYLPNGSNDWFKRGSGVTTAVVKVVATDTQSAVQGISCLVGTTPVTLTATGSSTDGKTMWGEISRTDDGVSAIKCSATDASNNTTAEGSEVTHSLRLDNTLPTVGCPTGSNTVFILNATAGSLTASVTDTATGASGVAAEQTSISVTGLSTAAMGHFTTTLTGVDVAGNAKPQSCGYDVRPIFVATNKATDGGLTKVKAGSAVPLKFLLKDANNDPVASIVTANLTLKALACGSTAAADTLTDASAGSSGLQNFGDGTYQFNWKSPSTFANSCRILTLDLGAAGGGLASASDFHFTK